MNLTTIHGHSSGSEPSSSPTSCWREMAAAARSAQPAQNGGPSQDRCKADRLTPLSQPMTMLWEEIYIFCYSFPGFCRVLIICRTKMVCEQVRSVAALVACWRGRVCPLFNWFFAELGGGRGLNEWWWARFSFGRIYWANSAVPLIFSPLRRQWVVCVKRFSWMVQSGW